MKIKRVLALTLIGMTSAVANAGVILAEGFDNVGALAGAGWVQTNNSSPIGISGWFQGNDLVFAAHSGAANSYVAANYLNATDGGAISNWLISPTLSFIGPGSLNFALRLLGDGFLDTVEVYFSANGTSSDVGSTASSTGDFSLASSFASNSDTNWVMQTVSIGAAGANNGRFAFRYAAADTRFDGNYIGIDSLTLRTPDQVPEPSSLLLAALALGGLGWSRRQWPKTL